MKLIMITLMSVAAIGAAIVSFTPKKAPSRLFATLKFVTSTAHLDSGRTSPATSPKKTS